MTRQEYNGWTNYETWSVKLWLDNDEGSYGYWGDQADAALERNAIATSRDDNELEYDTDTATSQLASQLNDTIREYAPDLGASCFADLLNAALSEVNWYEIAESLIEDAKERVTT
jgi:hypothetical protein